MEEIDREYRQADIERLFGAAPVALHNEQADVLLRGRMINEQLRNGLQLHATELEVLQPMHSDGGVGPGLKLILMLQGCAEARFGGCDIPLAANLQPECVLLAVAEPERFQRISRQIGHQRQLVLSVSDNWLVEGGLSGLPDFQAIEQFCRRHLAQRRLSATPLMLQLAESMLNPAGEQPYLQKLRREALALEFLAEVMTRFDGTATPGRISRKEQARMQNLYSLLESGHADSWALSDMAREIGSNITSMQRHFRQCYGRSIIDCQREMKLLRAYRALQQDATVTEAAMLAGYNSSANFATAFKRQFGYPPSRLRH